MCFAQLSHGKLLLLSTVYLFFVCISLFIFMYLGLNFQQDFFRFYICQAVLFKSDQFIPFWRIFEDANENKYRSQHSRQFDIVET